MFGRIAESLQLRGCDMERTLTDSEHAASMIRVTARDLRSGRTLSLRFALFAQFSGDKLTALPYHQSVLHDVHPVYAELPGWRTDLSACREVHDLPTEARQYLELIEQEVGVPITFVGTGPERDQYVQRA